MQRKKNIYKRYDVPKYDARCDESKNEPQDRNAGDVSSVFELHMYSSTISPMGEMRVATIVVSSDPRNTG